MQASSLGNIGRGIGVAHSLPIFLHTPCMYFFPLSLLYFSTPTPSTPGFPPAPCIPPAPPRTFYQFLAPIVFSISTDNLEIGQIQENSSTTVSSADPGPLYSKLRSIPLSILSQKGLNSTKWFDTHNVERICMPKVSHNLFKSGHLWIRHWNKWCFLHF